MGGFRSEQFSFKHTSCKSVVDFWVFINFSDSYSPVYDWQQISLLVIKWVNVIRFHIVEITTLMLLSNRFRYKRCTIHRITILVAMIRMRFASLSGIVQSLMVPIFLLCCESYNGRIHVFSFGITQNALHWRLGKKKVGPTSMKLSKHIP